MAGARVNNYSPSTADLTSVMGTLDGTRTGYIALSLTNYNSTSRPAISAGSQVEVAGALFRFSTEEAISTASVTSTATNTYYIRLVPSSSECTVQFSTAAPVWREDLQGWYQSTASANRYAHFTMQFSAGDYINKSEFSERSVYIGRRSSDHAATYNDIPVYGYLDDGTTLYSKQLSLVLAAGTASTSVAHGIPSAYTDGKILSVMAHSVVTVSSLNEQRITYNTAANEWYSIQWTDTLLFLLRQQTGATITYHMHVIYK